MIGPKSHSIFMRLMITECPLLLYCRFGYIEAGEHVRFSDFSTNPKLEDVKKGIESYWANGANKESKSYALKALEYLVPSICDVVAVPTSCVKRKNGSWRILYGKSD